MIYEDERSVDELVDDILNPDEDEGVRAGDTEAAADGRTTQRLYLNRI